MATVDQNLFLLPGETLDQYRARATGYLRSQPGRATMGQLAAEAPTDAPLGSVAYTSYLASQTPTSTTQAQTLPSVQTPQAPYGSGFVAPAIAGTTGLESYLKESMRAYEQERQALLGQQKEGESWLKSFLSNQQSSGDMRQELSNKYGMDPQQHFAEMSAGIQEVNTLNEQYNNLVASKEQQIAQAQGRTAPMSFINNQIAQINRNAAPELNRISAQINSKAALLQARQGNFDKAQQYIGQAIEDAMADRKFKLDSFSMFYEMNAASIERLDRQYKDALDKAFTLTKEDYDRAYKEKMQIAEWSLKYGIDLDMNGSIDDAVNALRASGKVPVGDALDEVDTYAQSYLDGLIDITNVPQALRAKVLARATELANAALNASQVTTETTSYAPSSPEAYGAGSRFGQALSPLGDVAGTYARGLREGTSGITSFFSGLFGR